MIDPSDKILDGLSPLFNSLFSSLLWVGMGGRINIQGTLIECQMGVGVGHLVEILPISRNKVEHQHGKKMRYFEICSFNHF
jgi:hypothetical protein